MTDHPTKSDRIEAAARDVTQFLRTFSRHQFNENCFAETRKMFALLDAVDAPADPQPTAGAISEWSPRAFNAVKDYANTLALDYAGHKRPQEVAEKWAEVCKVLDEAARWDIDRAAASVAKQPTAGAEVLQELEATLSKNGCLYWHGKRAEIEAAFEAAYRAAAKVVDTAIEPSSLSTLVNAIAAAVEAGAKGRVVVYGTQDMFLTTTVSVSSIVGEHLLAERDRAAKASVPVPVKQSEPFAMHPCLFHIDNGLTVPAVRYGTTFDANSLLFVDLNHPFGKTVIGHPEWFDRDYVTHWGGIVPECATEGTEPGQWSRT